MASLVVAEDNNNHDEDKPGSSSRRSTTIWHDSHVQRFAEHGKKGWKCLWCNLSFLGEPNATKCLAHLTRSAGKHIKLCTCATIPADKFAHYRHLQLDLENRRRRKDGQPEIGLEELPTPVATDKQVGPRTWADSLELLRAYKEEHGDCNIPKSYQKDKALGEWVVKQRQNQRKLLPEQRKQMEDLGFNFESRQEQQDRKWDAMLEETKAYKEKHGHFKIPAKATKDEKLKVLSRWMNYQRQHYKKKNLELSRVEKLNSIGFDWRADTTRATANTKKTTTSNSNDGNNSNNNNNKNHGHEAQWKENYDKLAQFHKEHGHCNLLTTHSDKSLYFWLKRQRNAFHKNQLRDDRKELLDQIGVAWDPKGEEALQNAWNVQFERLLEYGKEHGTVAVPHRYAPHTLGTWVASQKRFFRDGVIDPDRARRLLDAGLPIVVENEQSWNSRYERIKALDGSAWQDVPKHADLEKWGRLQLILEERNKLAADRRSKLEAIGFCNNERPQSPVGPKATTINSVLPTSKPQATAIPTADAEKEHESTPDLAGTNSNAPRATNVIMESSSAILVDTAVVEQPIDPAHNPPAAPTHVAALAAATAPDQPTAPNAEPDPVADLPAIVDQAVITLERYPDSPQAPALEKAQQKVELTTDPAAMESTDGDNPVGIKVAATTEEEAANNQKRTWQQSFEVPQEHKEEHRTCTLPSAYPEDPTLVQGSKKQCTSNPQLPSEQNDKLEGIGFVSI
ncbi:helicase [Seminavis robusta]|uniref:Helicase n=1 Tax=Seminavis robusta TaxID=568900 RepID=A0A9N8DNW0_9STRA|nr:helicase [Seminavis robusta]|eukprot:Sro266_g103260.1 helicase (737) ;mRNA; f:58506-60954